MTPIFAKFSNIKSLTLAECGLFICLIVFLYNNIQNIPIFDEWELAHLVEKYYTHTLNWQDLIVPHNECRMFYPHLINLGLILLTDWTVFYVILFNMVLMFCFYLVFKNKVKSLISLDSNLSNSLLFLIALIMIFSFKSYENIIMSFALVHYLSVSSTFFAIISLQKMSWKNILMACIFAHIATLSYATGFLTWVCVIIIITYHFIKTYLERNEITHLFTYLLPVIVFFLIHVFFYFHGYVANAEITKRTLSLFEIIPYCLVFLSNNFTSTVSIAITLSIIQLFSMALAAYNLFVHDKKELKNMFPLAIFGLYGILSSAMVAYGRASEGIEQALSKRYCTLSLPFVLIFIVSVMINLKYTKVKSKQVSLRQNFAITFVFFIYIILYQYRAMNFAINRNKEIIVAQAAILNSDYLNPLVKTNIYPNPEHLYPKVLILKKYKMAMFQKN
jgi:hypothetical protein